ncbi:unnamed protein product [Parnassius apollo]|uniref:(apollo) hypothetical protein n=1 Tax=Parnassius apollo TaxID=110799 RepID=A0A8S3X886_PARAO|nr:unnamed protein product [Parnassius apollo]
MSNQFLIQAESRKKSDFDIIDNLSETGKIDFDIPQCNLARANQDFIAVPEAESERGFFNRAIGAMMALILIFYTSHSTSNEDSDDSVKDPDFQIEERRSIKISDDSETEDNVGNQANFEATPAATSSVSTLYSSLDDTIPDTKKRSRKRVAKPTEWLQNKCKILRNEGSAYVTLKTKVKKDARKIKPPCSERCRLKCKEKFSEVDREAVFKEFWELKDINRKRDFNNRHMAPIKRKYRYTTTQKGDN